MPARRRRVPGAASLLAIGAAAALVQPAARHGVPRTAASAFLPSPMVVRLAGSRQLPQNPSSSRGTRDAVGTTLASSAAAAAAMGASRPAYAFELPQLPEPPKLGDIGQFAQRVFKIVTTGADEVYDPTTDEGAKALGLAYRLPKQGEYEQVTAEDFYPFIGALVVIIIWGVFVVPTFMDRADGSKTVLFPKKEDDEEEVVKEIVAREGALPKTEEAILKSKKLSKVEESFAAVAKPPPKRRAGFAKVKQEK